MTSTQVTAAGSAVLFGLCAVLLAWLGSMGGAIFGLGCSVVVGRFAVERPSTTFRRQSLPRIGGSW